MAHLGRELFNGPSRFVWVQALFLVAQAHKANHMIDQGLVVCLEKLRFPESSIAGSDDYAWLDRDVQQVCILEQLLLNSVAVLAEILPRSPRKLFFSFMKKYI